MLWSVCGCRGGGVLVLVTPVFSGWCGSPHKVFFSDLGKRLESAKYSTWEKGFSVRAQHKGP